MKKGSVRPKPRGAAQVPAGGVRATRPGSVLAPDSVRALAAEARRAARRAYAPYSRFRVGAALRDRKGAVFTGGNIENAAYPLGICAERAALLAWLQDGGAPIVSVAIATATERPTPPCGACRASLLRLAPDAEIYLVARRRIHGPYRAGDWLPASAAAEGVR